MNEQRRYYELKQQIDNLWAERDAIIDLPIDLDADDDTPRIDRLARIVDMAIQAGELEDEARRIYNNPATWATDITEQEDLLEHITLDAQTDYFDELAPYEGDLGRHVIISGGDVLEL